MAAVLAAGCTGTGGSATPAPTASQSAAASSAPASSAAASASASASDGVQPLPTPEVTSLKFAISATDANSYPIQLALDAGLYKKYGLDVQGFYIEGTQPTTQALLSGQVDFATNSASQTITSLTTSQPLVDVGILTNKLPDYLYGGKDVTDASSLKGKRIAISQFGGQSHGEVVVSLKELGLTSDDVQIVQIGGQSARIAALEAGSVGAAPAEAGLADKLTGEGFHVLVKLPEAKALFAGSNIQIPRAFVEKNPNTTLAIVAAVLDAVQYGVNNPEQTAKYYAKFSQMSEADALKAWQSFLGTGILQRDMRSTEDAYVPVRDVLANINPEVKDVDLTKAYDGSFLDKLEQMGYFKELGVPNS
jgi:NitT/TauT family transport system substrate-binding protein